MNFSERVLSQDKAEATKGLIFDLCPTRFTTIAKVVLDLERCEVPLHPNTAALLWNEHLVGYNRPEGDYA